MSENMYETLALTGKGNDPPCFCIVYIRMLDGRIYGVYPNGKDVIQIQNKDTGEPLTEEELLTQGRNLLRMPKGRYISIDQNEIGFAFGVNDIFVGTHSGLLIEMKQRLAGQLSDDARSMLTSALETLNQFIAM